MHQVTHFINLVVHINYIKQVNLNIMQIYPIFSIIFMFLTLIQLTKTKLGSKWVIQYLYSF